MKGIREETFPKTTFVDVNLHDFCGVRENVSHLGYPAMMVLCQHHHNKYTGDVHTKEQTLKWTNIRNS